MPPNWLNNNFLSPIKWF